MRSCTLDKDRGMWNVFDTHTPINMHTHTHTVMEDWELSRIDIIADMYRIGYLLSNPLSYIFLIQEGKEIYI